MPNLQIDTGFKIVAWRLYESDLLGVGDILDAFGEPVPLSLLASTRSRSWRPAHARTRLEHSFRACPLTARASNVLVSVIPNMSKLHAQVYAHAAEIGKYLLPRTTAYHEIWLDKKMVVGEALKDVEPMYGEFYLPRKMRPPPRPRARRSRASNSRSRLRSRRRTTWTCICE
jgi:hypothetical protein